MLDASVKGVGGDWKGGKQGGSALSIAENSTPHSSSAPGLDAEDEDGDEGDEDQDGVDPAVEEQR